MGLTRRLAFGMALALMMTSVSKGAAILSIPPETLDPGFMSGFFVVQIASDGMAGGMAVASEAVGSFDLDLDFTNFTGVMSGQQVNVTSFTALFGSFLGAPATGPVGENTSIVVQGNTTPMDNLITTTPRDFFRVDFTTPVALDRFDNFTVDFNASGQVIGIAGGFENIYGGSTGQPIGVPEPGSIAFCGFIAAGFASRQIRKRKKKQAEAA